MNIARPSVIGTPYDEVCDETGRRRPPYDHLALELGWDPLDPPAPVQQGLADRPLGDDTPILPVPVALDDEECRSDIHTGVVQRARTLQQFFADVVLGAGTFLRAGSDLTDGLFDEILVSEGTSTEELRRYWAGHALDSVRFVYAPDLMRDPSGRWLVIEDNVGCVTGCVDSRLVLDAYRRVTNLGVGAPRPPDLRMAVERWLGLLGLAPDHPGVRALMSDGHASHSSNGLRFAEDDRRGNLMGQLGIAPLRSDDFDGSASASSLPFQALINIGVPASMEQWSLLLDAFGRLRLPFLNAPGTSVLGSKALLPFVNEMALHYLGEELLLDCPPTELLRDGRLPPSLEDSVVKTAAGCQGTGVFILRSLPKHRLETITELLATSWPAKAAVGQARVEPSRIRAAWRGGSEFLVELRPVGYVLAWQDVFVGEHFLAKLAPGGTPDALNNITYSGAYAPVVRVSAATNGEGGAHS